MTYPKFQKQCYESRSGRCFCFPTQKRAQVYRFEKASKAKLWRHLWESLETFSFNAKVFLVIHSKVPLIKYTKQEFYF